MTPLPSDGLPPRYRVERVVGEGGFGVVLRTHDQELDRPVAIKRLHAGLADDETRARFEREARSTAGLRHPHVLQVLDFGTDAQGAPYLVYEWVDGEDLHGVGASPAELRRWGAAIADALHAAHRAGVVHRDVKPANVLRRGDGHVLLCDLGIAKVAGGQTVQTAEGLILGTPAYMAPELFHGEPASPASDQWAWAASLVELAGGSSPWGCDDPAGVIEASRSPRAFQAPEPLRASDAALAATLARALAWDPAARFPDLAAFAEALRSGESPAAPPPSSSATRVLAGRTAPSAAASPVPTPRRLPPALIAVGAFGLVALGAAVVPRTRPPPTSPSLASPAAPGPPERDQTAEAVLAARAHLLGAHLDARDRRAPRAEQRAALAEELATDRRLALRFERFLEACQAWMRARPSPWSELEPAPDPSGDFRFLRGEILQALDRLLRALQLLRQERDDAARAGPLGLAPVIGENEGEILFLAEGFARELAGGPPGIARTILLATVVSAYTPGDLRRAPKPQEVLGEAPTPAELRRQALRDLARAFAASPSPEAAFELGVAARRLMLSIPSHTDIDGAQWARLMEGMVSALPPPAATPAGGPRGKGPSALALGVIRALVVGAEARRADPGPRARAAARAAWTWLGTATGPGGRSAGSRPVANWITEAARWARKRREREFLPEDIDLREAEDALTALAAQLGQPGPPTGI